MAHDTRKPGAPPRSGWQRFVCELDVENLAASLAFWHGLLGFETAYARPEQGFVYLEHPEGHQVMLNQAGPAERGQGVLFQLYFKDLAAIRARLTAADWPLERPFATVWRRLGTMETGQEEFWVRDPDRYLLMLAHNLGERETREPK